MAVLTGTSGFSYKEWKGSFYPADVRAEDMLAAYAERLGAVEINNTFYRMPRSAVLEGWAEQVPEDFRFAIKASRRITHFSRLKEPDELLGYLLAATAHLGSKLGTLLFQLPPNMKADVDRLATFLAALPDGTPAAFEFRHPSWHDQAVYALLTEHDCALVTSESDEEDEPPAVVATAGWGYLRLRRTDYDEARLAAWRSVIDAQAWSHAFVFFKHEDAGAGPALAARMAALFGS